MRYSMCFSLTIQRIPLSCSSRLQVLLTAAFWRVANSHLITQTGKVDCLNYKLKRVFSFPFTIVLQHKFLVSGYNYQNIDILFLNLHLSVYSDSPLNIFPGTNCPLSHNIHMESQKQLLFTLAGRDKLVIVRPPNVVACFYLPCNVVKRSPMSFITLHMGQRRGVIAVNSCQLGS